MSDIYRDFDNLESRLRDPGFRRNSGIGNEVAYYVFHYEPKNELVVRSRITAICKNFEKSAFGFHVVVFDVYEIMIELLKQEGILDACFEMEETDGFAELKNQIDTFLSLTDDKKPGPLLSVIKNNTQDNAIVFLSGIGKCYPFIRSHTILNNLHKAITGNPVILFFPGSYDGRRFALFSPASPIESQNYYRAFPINQASTK
jgi:hypothetical protein